MECQDNSKKVDIQELIEMCKGSPTNVTLSNRAQQDASADFGLDSASDVKAFIGDGNLENTTCINCVESREIPETFITAYGFSTGRKQGYLAYHRKQTDLTKLHIKSFHKNTMHSKSAIGTLADIFPAKLDGGHDNG
jgi:hypothetical protein